MVLAQGSTIAGSQIKGPLVGIEKLADVINIVFSFIFPAFGLLLLVYFIYAGLEMMLSEGDSNKVQSAKRKFTHTIVGFAIFVLTYLFIKFLAFILGINSELFGMHIFA